MPKIGQFASRLQEMADGLMREFWIFGYGSLMWRPGFPYQRALPARLWGYHRSLCIYSLVHRGTPERPGLVLGLDRGGSCRGVAFAVADADIDAVLEYLRARELVTSVYLEKSCTVRLLDGNDRAVSAVCYVADGRHEQYAGKLSDEAVLAHVEQGRGGYGDNRDYVIATQNHLVELGIHDPQLSWLTDRLRQRGYDPAGSADT